jgi:hypothetical protein
MTNRTVRVLKAMSTQEVRGRKVSKSTMNEMRRLASLVAGLPNPMAILSDAASEMNRKNAKTVTKGQLYQKVKHFAFHNPDEFHAFAVKNRDELSTIVFQTETIAA